MFEILLARRDLIRGLVATGFALGVLPVGVRAALGPVLDDGIDTADMKFYAWTTLPFDIRNFAYLDEDLLGQYRRALARSMAQTQMNIMAEVFGESSSADGKAPLLLGFDGAD